MIKVAVDVETSGFKPYWHDVITIGLCVYEVQKVLDPIATFYGSCRPFNPKNWDEGSQVAHGFTLAEAMTWQDPRLLSIQILHFLKRFLPNPWERLTFVQHSVNQFDFLHTQALFINSELQFSFYRVFSETQTHSTLLQARNAGYTKNSLSDWGPRLNRQFAHHNALDDAIMAAAIDCHISSKEGQNAFESITEQGQELQQKRKRKTSELPSLLRESSKLI